eukprot:1234192-Rhodomonas_salina.1
MCFATHVLTKVDASSLACFRPQRLLACQARCPRALQRSWGTLRCETPGVRGEEHESESAMIQSLF